jgi:hypothetical protein
MLSVAQASSLQLNLNYSPLRYHPNYEQYHAGAGWTLYKSTAQLSLSCMSIPTQSIPCAGHQKSFLPDHAWSLIFWVRACRFPGFDWGARGEIGGGYWGLGGSRAATKGKGRQPHLRSRRMENEVQAVKKRGKCGAGQLCRRLISQCTNFNRLWEIRLKEQALQYWILLTSYCLASLFTDPHTKIAVLLPGLCFLKIVNRCLSNNVRVPSSGICTAVSPKTCCILVFWVLPTTAGLLRLHDLLPRRLSVKRISRNQIEDRFRIFSFDPSVCPICPGCISCVREIKIVNSPFLGKIHPVNNIFQIHEIARVHDALDEDRQLWIRKTHLTPHNARRVIWQMGSLYGYDMEENISETKALEKRIGVGYRVNSDGWTWDFLADARKVLAFQKIDGFLKWLCWNANIPGLKSIMSSIACDHVEDGVGAYISSPPCSIVQQSRYTYYAAGDTGLFKFLYDLPNLQSPMSTTACVWLCGSVAPPISSWVLGLEYIFRDHQVTGRDRILTFDLNWLGEDRLYSAI